MSGSFQAMPASSAGLYGASTLYMAGCSSKSKTYSYQFDEYQGFSARNDFLTQSDADGSDPEARLLADADQNVLSGNLFDQQSTPKQQRATNDKVISENLFELAAMHPHKGGVFERMLLLTVVSLPLAYALARLQDRVVAAFQARGKAGA